MPIRASQWASGRVGRHAARACRGRSGLEFVGLHSYAAAKIGRDVGDVLGSAPTGVRVTGGIAAVLTSSANVVVYTPLPSLVYGPFTDMRSWDTIDANVRFAPESLRYFVTLGE